MNEYSFRRKNLFYHKYRINFTNDSISRKRISSGGFFDSSADIIGSDKNLAKRNRAE